MDYYQLMTTNLNLQFALTETQFLGDNRQSFEQQRLILLRTLLCLLDQSYQPLAPKQAETLFFNLIKALSHYSYQVQAAALYCVSAISSQITSAFFATRSITTVYEKFNALRPQCLRLLGKVANSASLGDLQRLIKYAITDKNERLVTAAMIAAKRNKVAVAVDVSKVVGCGGYVCGYTQDLDKLLGSIKSANYYCYLATLERVKEIQDERKRMQAILQFIPNEARDLRQDWFFVYLEALKYLNSISFSVLKVNLHTVLYVFIMILQASRSDTQKIAVLRQVLRVYAYCPRQGDLFAQISDALRRASVQGSNLSISALALTSLVAAQPEAQSITRLMQILPNLTGGIKEDALGTLEALAKNYEQHAFAVTTAANLLDSYDLQARQAGFQMLLHILDYHSTSAVEAAALLLDKIEACDDSMQCRQACEVLCDSDCDYVKLIDVLLQKALLGTQEVRSAAFNGLKTVYAKSRETNASVARCATLAIQALEKDDFDDFDLEEPENGEVIAEFDPEDFLLQQELLLNGNYDKIYFGIAAKTQHDTKSSKKYVDSEIVGMIEPGYDEMFTRGEFEQASSQTLDVSVSLCKVFLTRAGYHYLQLLYKVVPDDGVYAENIEIRIGKVKSTKIDKNYYSILLQYKNLDDIRSFSNIKMKYSTEDDDETVKLFDVTVSSYDLIQALEVDNYAQYYSEHAASTEEMVIHLQDIPDVATALENIPSYCGLLNVEVVSETYKKATFFMTGKLNGVGEIVCKVDIKLSKVGVKAKLHCVGPATEQFYSVFG